MLIHINQAAELGGLTQIRIVRVRGTVLSRKLLQYRIFHYA